jgi:hypothetical protein
MSVLFSRESQEKKVVSIVKEPVWKEKSIFPVLRSDQLLSPQYYQILQENIRKSIDASDDVYRVLYRQLINNFVEFSQILPTTNLSRLGSLMQQGILRMVYMLEVCQNNKEPLEPIWIYVLASAAILFDVAKTTEERTIILCNNKGEFYKKWLPYEGTLVDEGKYYKMRRGGGIAAWVSRKVTTLLAYKLMPYEGFKWLAGNTKAFNVWLALLNDDSKGAGEYALLFDKMHDLLKDFLEHETVPFDPEVEPIEASDFDAGEEFAKWLRDGIENDAIKVNSADAKVHVTEEGLFIDASLFHEFSDFCNSREGFKERFQEWRVVFKQFNHIGFTKLSGYDYKFEQFFSENPDSTAQKAVSFLTTKRPQSPLREGVISTEPGYFLGNKAFANSTYIRPVETQVNKYPAILPAQAGVDLTKK